MYCRLNSHICNERKHANRVKSLTIHAVVLACVISLLGCDKPVPLPANVPPPVSTVPPKVMAQGKLLPKTGVLQIAAMPGDRVEQLKVQAGDVVNKGDPLVILASEAIRRDELSIAQQKLTEAKSQLEAKRKEADLQVRSAELQVSQAKLQIEQAEKSLDAAKRQATQLTAAKEQVDRLIKLSTDPKTRGLVGSIEAEQKRIELDRNQSQYEQVVLAAEQAVSLAGFGLEAAERKLQLAIDNRNLVDSIVPIGSAEQQVELLKKQIETSRVLAPISGVILTVSAKEGDMVSQLPLMEMANLSEMVCVSEVSDASVQYLKIGQSVIMESAALAEPLHGKVQRIDRMVGSPQMKIPSPLAKTDFRAVPVWIAIDANDNEAAAKLVQLHVDVTITIETSTEPAKDAVIE
jgi:HlyD family secretion protein